MILFDSSPLQLHNISRTPICFSASYKSSKAVAPSLSKKGQQPRSNTRTFIAIARNLLLLLSSVKACDSEMPSSSDSVGCRRGTGSLSPSPDIRLAFPMSPSSTPVSRRGSLASFGSNPSAASTPRLNLWLRAGEMYAVIVGGHCWYSGRSIDHQLREEGSILGVVTT